MSGMNGSSWWDAVHGNVGKIGPIWTAMDYQAGENLFVHFLHLIFLFFCSQSINPPQEIELV